MKVSILIRKYNWIIVFGLILAGLSLYAGRATFSGEKKEAASPDAESTRTRKIRLALLLDTSNSMDGLIEQAKSQLWTIVNELASARCDSLRPEIEIALYEYGNDMLWSGEGYIRQVLPFTSDLDKISAELFGLVTDGGKEFCGQVIQMTTRQLVWSPDSNDLQLIFIAGNEPFSQGNVSFKEACTEAKRKHITVNTIFCGPFQEGLNTGWKQGAELTGGSYMSIEQNLKTVFIPSPYDDRISELNTRLNDTYLEYGSEGKRKKELQIVQDKNASAYGSANSVNRAVSKTSHVYNNKSWDLIDASEEKNLMQKLSPQNSFPILW